MLAPHLADVVRSRIDDVVVGVFRIAVAVGGLVRGLAPETQARHIVRVSIRCVGRTLYELVAADTGADRVKGEQAGQGLAGLRGARGAVQHGPVNRSEEHTSELQSPMYL